MTKKKDKGKPAGHAISGPISDRIRRGEIAADPLATRPPADDRPKVWAILFGSGRGLGAGATRRRDSSGNDDTKGRGTRR